jgi:hypothetical protein
MNPPINRTFAIRLTLLLCILPFVCQSVRAQFPFGTNSPAWLDHWAFNRTNVWSSDNLYFPRSFTNLSGSDLGDLVSVVVDSTNEASLCYSVLGTNGTNEITVDVGSVVFWFAPNWASTNAGGTGPGNWARLIEIGAPTEDASYGWWSVYTDPDGENIYFSAQSNDGSGGTYLSAPITWTSNRWHLIALTYSSTNSSLYLDAELMTNGLPVTVWPSSDVLSNGFFLGSASNGLAQAHGMFDDMSTYDHEIDLDTIYDAYFIYSVFFYGNPMNAANFQSAPSDPGGGPSYNAITGPGYLVALSNLTVCVTNDGVWLTNLAVATALDGTRNIAFSIQGGLDGAYYDVFANSVLDFSTNSALAWAWMGQGAHCASYMLTNMPASGSVFLILGQATDSDSDGLTDAYELLASKTDPHNPDTDGDGLPDSWEVLLGLNPGFNDNAQTASRLNYFYDPTAWLQSISGARTGSVSLDPEGNILTVSQ